MADQGTAEDRDRMRADKATGRDRAQDPTTSNPGMDDTPMNASVDVRRMDNTNELDNPGVGAAEITSASNVEGGRANEGRGDAEDSGRASGTSNVLRGTGRLLSSFLHAVAVHGRLREILKGELALHNCQALKRLELR